MAVQKMKLVSITGPLDDFEKVAGSCIVNHEFHPEYALDVMQQAKILRRMDDTNPYAGKLESIVSIARQLGIKLSFQEFSETEMKSSDSLKTCEDLFERVQNLRKESERLLNVAAENEQIIKQLDHIRDMNFDLHDLFEAEFVKFRFGRLPKQVYDSFSDEINRSNDIFLFVTSLEKDFVYCMILTTRANENKADALFAAYGFERIFIAGKVRGSSDEAKQSLLDETAKARADAKSLSEEADRLVAEKSKSILAYYSYVRFNYETAELRKFAARTDTSFYLFGWVLVGAVPDLTANLERWPNVTYSVDEPSRLAGIKPPVVLRNAAIFRPFEPFIEMYGKPSYGEIDPTPVMAVFYTLLFGIMFGDVGQGLILAGVGFLMWKLKKMWLGRVLIYTGFAGSCFGLVYGSLFGFEHLLPFGFKVLESAANTDKMLSTAVYVGVGVIFAVMCLNIINGFKQKDYEKALFSQNGIAGIILYISIMLLVLPMLGFLDVNVMSNGFIVFGIIIPLIAIVFRDPLGKLISGEKNWLPSSIVDFLMENIFELIEVFLSYIANTISFLRVGIYALSHAGMMMVVFLLAGDPPNPVVVILGNIFVMGVEGLLVGIQVLRLNFYEIFGRFLSAEGKAYRPVMIDYKTLHE